LLDRGHGKPAQSFTGSLNAHYSISDRFHIIANRQPPPASRI
jgi:hypothetical protein